MSLPHFAGALRTLGLSLGAAALASLAATASFAQTPDDEVKRPAKTEAKAEVNGMDAAPQIVAAAKLNCEPVNARVIGPTETDGADGKKVKASLYEIACKTGPGFIITAVTPDQVKEPFNCNLLVKIREKDPSSIACALPENTPEHKWLTPAVQPFIPGCEVNQARLIGSTTTEPRYDRYEVACASGAGGVLDHPALGVTAPTEFKNCLVYEGSSSACTFTTKAQMIESLKPLAAAGKADCQVSDVRFVGVNSANDGYYYEFGCGSTPGFIALADLNHNFVRAVPCANAMGLGGCQFTDAGAAAADANSYMTQALKAGGVNCTVQEFNLIGTQEASKRDYVEFKCSEQPWGVIGFVPQPGTDGQTRVYDCFMDQVARKACTFVSEETLRKQLDKLIKIAQPGKDCDVKEVRYIGESGAVENGVLAELACVNKRGYIVVLNPDRNSLAESVPCTVARSQNLEEKCAIPGNGTYASAND